LLRSVTVYNYNPTPVSEKKLAQEGSALCEELLSIPFPNQKKQMGNALTCMLQMSKQTKKFITPSTDGIATVSVTTALFERTEIAIKLL